MSRSPRSLSIRIISSGSSEGRPNHLLRRINVFATAVLGAHHSTFSVNRLGRFRESEILRHIFERVFAECMATGLIKGEGFAADAGVMEANASRYHGKAPNEMDWTAHSDEVGRGFRAKAAACTD